MKRHYPRTYVEWTSEEDKQLSEQCKKGTPLLEMSKFHEREPVAIRRRLIKLDLIDVQNDT